MQQVSIIARLQAAAGQREDLLNAFQVALETAVTEPDTRRYIVHTDDKEADVLWVYEMYENRAAADTHLQSDSFKALASVLGPFLGGRPQLTFATPVGGKGL